MSLPVSIFCLLVAVASAAKLPADWITCKHDDEMNKCLEKAMAKALETLVPGYPALGVFPLDPLHFDSLSIHQGDGPVSIELDFTHLDLYGVKDLKIHDVNNDWNEMTVKLSSPKILLKGEYEIKGKVMVLPVNGKGPSMFSLEKFEGVGTIKFSKNTVGNKEYYHIDSLKFTFDCDHMTISLENLFDGDKALGENMNKFINENWKEILHELKPAISSSFGAAFKEIGNRVFSKLPVTSITPS